MEMCYPPFQTALEGSQPEDKAVLSVLSVQTKFAINVGVNREAVSQSSTSSNNRNGYSHLTQIKH